MSEIKPIYFQTVSLASFTGSGTKLEQAVKQLLFSDANYRYELIEKGFLSPDGTTVINPTDFQKKLQEATLSSQGAVGDTAKIAANKFMHMLGCAEQDTEEIPRQAYDASFYQTPILGQNRIAYMRMSNVDYHHGLMLGGLGTGGIEMTPQGSFRRIGFTFVGQNVEDLADRNAATKFHIFLKAGDKQYASVLSTEKPADKLSAWKWELSPDSGSYHALYPIEWHQYEGKNMPAEVAITSFSPIIQENYKETSYPVVVYKVKIKNTSAVPLDGAFMFTIQNLTGWMPNTAGNTWAPDAFETVERKTADGIQPIFGSDSAKDFRSEWSPESQGNHNGIQIDENGNTYLLLGGERNEIPDVNGQIAVAIPKMKGVSVSYVETFDVNGDGAPVASFYQDGALLNNGKHEMQGKDIGGAIAFKVEGLAPGEEIEVPVVLAYDFPLSKQDQTVLAKRYTEFFGTDGDNALQIASLALSNYKEWEQQVVASQKEIALDQPNLPDWYEGAALNKLVLLQTNSIGWFNTDQELLGGYPHAQAEEGLHLSGESNKVDYNHVETFDVRGYAWALAMLWPELDQAVLNYYAETIPQEDASQVFFREFDQAKYDALKAKYLKAIEAAPSPEEKAEIEREMDLMLTAANGPRKRSGAMPHDIWSSITGPVMNTYTHQNPNLWPGLAPLGVLQALRNYQLTEDKVDLARQYDGFKTALDYIGKMDRNSDGIPDFLIPKNDEGVAIWTYDNWKWSEEDGINAYNAGLWLVALAAAVNIAQTLGKTADAERYSALLQEGKQQFDRELWKQTGENTGYYKLGPSISDIFSDYLYFLYDRSLGLNVFDPDKVKMTLGTVYEQNVQNFGNGFMGAVNGTRDGKIIEGEQEREVWLGASFALGATMLAYGMEEGWNVIYGTENLGTNLAGNFADWAEAYTLEPGKDGVPAYGIRAKNYLRVLSIFDALWMHRKKQDN